MNAEVIKYRLKKNYGAVLSDLEPRKVLSYLYQEDIIDEDDMDEVRSEKTRKRQAETLLSMLKRRNEHGYKVLVDALDEYQPHLARVLKTPMDFENGPPPQSILLQAQEHGNDEMFEPNLRKIEEAVRDLHLYNVSGPSEHEIGPVYQITSASTEKGSALCVPTTDPPMAIRPTSLDLISKLYHPDSKDVYRMKGSPRGLAVIINFQKFDPNSKYTSECLEERFGSQGDIDGLGELFQGLDFDVKSYHDLTLEETTATMSSLGKDASMSTYDCFVLCLMSHGKEDFLYTSDGGQMKVPSIRTTFSNGNCPALAGKPKLFFIQACRGVKKDFGIIVQDGPNTPTENQEVEAPFLSKEMQPKYSFNLSSNKGPSSADLADFLLAYSSVDGHASFRNTQEGSRFIRCIIQVFREYAGVDDVMSMLTRVINMVNSLGTLGSKQVPQPETTLTKKVFFWPGIKFDNQ